MSDKENIVKFTLFELSLLIVLIALNVISSIINKNYYILEYIMSIAGVLNVVLVAKGEISNYIFGMIQTALYAYISWKGHVWGQMALFALFFFPMQFIGYFEWKRNLKNDNSSQVKSRNLNAKKRLLVYALTIIGILLVSLILKLFKGSVPYLDAATTVLNIVAMILMVKGFSDQWYLWILINVISIVLWLKQTHQGAQYGVVVSIMWFVYLINSIYGLILWKKSAKNIDCKI